MTLHGGGHLELQKMHKEDFWGLLRICLWRCPGIIPVKISFLQFYSRLLCFFYLCSCTDILCDGSIIRVDTSLDFGLFRVVRPYFNILSARKVRLYDFVHCITWTALASYYLVYSSSKKTTE